MSKYVLTDKEGKIDVSKSYISFHVLKITLLPSYYLHLTQPMDAIESVRCNIFPKTRQKESLEQIREK